MLPAGLEGGGCSTPVVCGTPAAAAPVSHRLCRVSHSTLSFHALIPCSHSTLSFHALIPRSHSTLSFHALIPCSHSMLSFHALIPCSHCTLRSSPCPAADAAEREQRRAGGGPHGEGQVGGACRAFLPCAAARPPDSLAAAGLSPGRRQRCASLWQQRADAAAYGARSALAPTGCQPPPPAPTVQDAAAGRTGAAHPAGA